MLLPSDSDIAEKEIEKKERKEMLEFGMIGFYRFNGFEATRTYLRTHVFSTVMLNLDKPVKVEYELDAYVWEDIQLGKPQLRKGGCAELFASPPDQLLLLPPEQLPAIVLSTEHTHAQEPKDLKDLLERLDFRDKLNHPLALTYLREMNDNRHYTLDLFIRAWLGPKTAIDGRDTLEKGLEKAGVVLPAHNMAMTLAIQKMHERPVEQGRAKKGKTEWRERGAGEGGRTGREKGGKGGR